MKSNLCFLGQVTSTPAYPLMATTAEEEKMIRDHEKLLRYTAKQFLRPRVSIDDLLQEGRMALVLASRKCKGEASIWTYAHRTVWRQMLRLVLRTTLEHLLGDEESGETAGLSPSQEHTVLLTQLFESLDPEERELVRARLGSELTVRELALELGVSKSEADRRWQATMESMRRRAA